METFSRSAFFGGVLYNRPSRLCGGCSLRRLSRLCRRCIVLVSVTSVAFWGDNDTAVTFDMGEQGSFSAVANLLADYGTQVTPWCRCVAYSVYELTTSTI